MKEVADGDCGLRGFTLWGMRDWELKNVRHNVNEGQGQRSRKSRQRRAISAGHKGREVGKLASNWRLEEWLGFGCLGVGKKAQCKQSQGEVTRALQGALSLRGKVGWEDGRFGIGWKSLCIESLPCTRY
jgi:hypothetical protein